jgi:hypothetical protein
MDTSTSLPRHALPAANAFRGQPSHARQANGFHGFPPAVAGAVSSAREFPKLIQMREQAERGTFHAGGAAYGGKPRRPTADPQTRVRAKPIQGDSSED